MKKGGMLKHQHYVLVHMKNFYQYPSLLRVTFKQM